MITVQQLKEKILTELIINIIIYEEKNSIYQ